MLSSIRDERYKTILSEQVPYHQYNINVTQPSFLVTNKVVSSSLLSSPINPTGIGQTASTSSSGLGPPARVPRKESRFYKQEIQIPTPSFPPVILDSSYCSACTSATRVQPRIHGCVSLQCDLVFLDPTKSRTVPSIRLVRQSRKRPRKTTGFPIRQ